MQTEPYLRCAMRQWTLTAARNTPASTNGRIFIRTPSSTSGSPPVLPVPVTTRTLGQNVVELETASTAVTVWDVGGSEAIRPMWKHYVGEADKIVYVIDSRLGAGEIEAAIDILLDVERAAAIENFMQDGVGAFARRKTEATSGRGRIHRGNIAEPEADAIRWIFLPRRPCGAPFSPRDPPASPRPPFRGAARSGSACSGGSRTGCRPNGRAAD